MTKSQLEIFFLKNILKISAVSISILILINMGVTLTHSRIEMINIIILIAMTTTYLMLKNKKYETSALLFTLLPLMGMFYRIVATGEILLPLVAIFAIGFTISVLFKDKLRWILHWITIIGLIFIFNIRAQEAVKYGNFNISEYVILSIAFLLIYILMVFTTGVLKSRCDRMQIELRNCQQSLERQECREKL
ncbi:MAG TPA: hypothetical protein PKL31_09730 [Fulvivirga sp.]|nr:hypothetical protein [Fulvivirga sp.]